MLSSIQPPLTRSQWYQSCDNLKYHRVPPNVFWRKALVGDACSKAGAPEFLFVSQFSLQISKYSLGVEDIRLTFKCQKPNPILTPGRGSKVLQSSSHSHRFKRKKKRHYAFLLETSTSKEQNYSEPIISRQATSYKIFKRKRGREGRRSTKLAHLLAKLKK